MKIPNKPRGPSSDSQAKKTRSIEEVMRIEALEFGSFELGVVLTPKESLVQLRQQSELNRTFSDWMMSIHSSAKQVNEGGMSLVSLYPF